MPDRPAPVHAQRSPDRPRAPAPRDAQPPPDASAAGAPAHLRSLNPAQARAASHAGPAPLLVIAGAGSGKTNTLAHRVAHLVLTGADPARMLLLTFTRRAALEMTRRAEQIVARTRRDAQRSRAAAAGRLPWSGTFHAVANRLLRLHAAGVALDPAFTVLDRSDAADLLDLVRTELGQAKTARRFPKKATCLAIYSRAVSTQAPLPAVLRAAFPWCQEWELELAALFRGYVDAKQRRGVLDYDDLLLYWYYLMQEPALAAQVTRRFDHVLVDEYQDTSPLQAAIVRALRPDGDGVTAVGDDAQAIYSFRAATVRNILDFPAQWPTPAEVVTLEENYRSTQPILDAANAVIAQAPERYTKDLRSRRASAQKPVLVTAEDELCQVDYVIERVLTAREAGVALQRQAVLFRAAHHSDALEVELGRRNIPYVKYGGLKFLEAAHVKDMVCMLRWAENPRDTVAGFRVLNLLPGVGPATANRALAHVEEGGGLAALASWAPPAAAREAWVGMCALYQALRDPGCPWLEHVRLAREWYQPICEQRYDAAAVRAGDLDQLDQIASGYDTRERFLSELALDPPEATGDWAGPPHLDEDFLILSTIHSAKGQEWDAVYVLNVADGCIPSDMAVGDAEQLDEERRLLYVAMTRARDDLHLVHPLRMFVKTQHRHGDRYVITPLSRFLPDELMPRFERRSVGRGAAHVAEGARDPAPVVVDVAAKLRGMW